MPPSLSRQWQFAQMEVSSRLQSFEPLGLDPLIAEILANRGVETLEAAQSFLHPNFNDLSDPNTLLDMDLAIRRTLEAFRDGEKILVFGDDDVDGITSASCVYLFFLKLEVDVGFKIPIRSVDGSGLRCESIREASAKGVTLLITTDCGINSVEEIALAGTLGIDVIVLDHHMLPDTLPNACAILNPLRPESAFPFGRLAAVGVSYNFVSGLYGALCDYGLLPNNWMDLREYLDIVALGTVADVMPLVSENRIYVREGLKVIRKRRRPGVSALLERAHADDQPITARTIGYRIAPLLNAAGRMGDAGRCVELLSTTSYKRADELARELERDNQERQRCEREILTEALKLASEEFDAGKSLLMLWNASWHPGVLGIVASRVKERYHRPSALVAINQETGIARVSMRSIPGIDLIKALKSTEKLLESYGGHIAAAGMTLKVANLEAVRDSLEAAIRSQADPLPTPKLKIDARCSLSDLTPEFADDLALLAPFGAGNPEPVLLASKVRVLKSRVINDRHLRLKLREGDLSMNAIGFTLATEWNLQEQPVDAVFTPRVMHPWQQQQIELNVLDIRPHRPRGSRSPSKKTRSSPKDHS